MEYTTVHEFLSKQPSDEEIREFVRSHAIEDVLYEHRDSGLIEWDLPEGLSLEREMIDPEAFAVADLRIEPRNPFGFFIEATAFADMECPLRPKAGEVPGRVIPARVVLTTESTVSWHDVMVSGSVTVRTPESIEV